MKNGEMSVGLSVDSATGDIIGGENVTMKYMCEKIVEANFLLMPTGKHPTAEDIFNYSSTGELSMIFSWYEGAKLILAELDKGGE